MKAIDKYVKVMKKTGVFQNKEMIVLAKLLIELELNEVEYSNNLSEEDLKILSSLMQDPLKLLIFRKEKGFKLTEIGKDLATGLIGAYFFLER